MKLNYKRTFLIGLAFLSISAFWQMYDSIVPLMLQNTFHLGETVTGALMAMDNVLAIFLLPFFGALSDKADTRIGKRMPFIVVGTVLAVAFLMLLDAADRSENLWMFVGVLFLILLAMGLYRSPAVALMPDLTPKPLRSKANAVINLMGAVGGVYTLLMIRMLVGPGERPDYLPLFMSIGGLMVAAVAVLFLTIREKKLAGQIEEEWKQQTEEDETESGEAVNADMPREVKRSMRFLLVSIFFWFMAYNAVTTAFSRYTRTIWHMEGGTFADCLMVATVVAILSFIPIGNIASRIGRKKTIIIGVVLMSICYLIVAFATEYHPVINVVFALIGIGSVSYTI